MPIRKGRRPRKSENASGHESPTLGSSLESSGSSGMFANQYSDSTDYDQSPSSKSTPKFPPAFRQRELMAFDREQSKENMDVKRPLLEVKLGMDKYKGYTELPGSNEENANNVSYLASSQSYDSLKMKREDNKHSSLVTIFAVWNTIMGSSLLTMAWGIERAGLLPGIIMMTIMGGLCLFTSHILLRVSHHHSGDAEWEVSDLCRMLLGRWAEIIAKIFSVVVMLGANIVYWILMTNFLYYSVNYFIDSPVNITQMQLDNNGGVLCPGNPAINITMTDNDLGHSSWGGSYWDLYSSVPIYVAIIIFPLLNFRSGTFFTKFNSLGTLSVLYLMLFVIIKGAGWGLNIESWVSEFTFKRHFSVLSGMLALSFYIHNIIITVMRHNRQQEKNGRDLSIAFLLVIITYMLVGAVFYVCFPLAKSCIEDNILNNFVKHDALSAVARVLLLFQVITVYPLIAYMLRIQILGPAHTISRWRVIVFNIFFMTICILFACFMPKIGTIIRYTGALSGLVHVFTLPSMLQITSLYIRGKLTIFKIIFYVFIFLIGAFNLLAQFFIVDN